MKYNSALFIYNGNAGQKESSQLLSICLPVLAESIDTIMVQKCLRPKHAKELCEELGGSFEIVIVLGGDGTIHECINGLAKLEKRPVLAILPGGTCNDFTRVLNISQNIQLAVEEIVNGKEEMVDLVQVGEDVYFLNFWGIGLVAEAATSMSTEEKNKLGKASYFLNALRTIQSQKPIEMTITTDGENWSGEAVMVLISNGNSIASYNLPFSTIQWNDGLLDVFIIKNANFKLMKGMIALKNENADAAIKEEILYFQGKDIQIETKEEVAVDMDGEVYTQTPSTLKVLPRYITMIVPTQNR
ncbi:diacylglycerol/lipid kinase family protein [Bacillus sp. B1-b2]|uniref:diacylglycerol/lipid kinase family protein n=1 Tax=Bacillus sp. B1-b2 TaxID=2653201 RepID=UPI00126209B8|nr:YegS/Rv2252/BmrU family lipid kinase [Bacillus sp. B1-b2]KAB7668803.1 YegS/Rv2252/BmrU family lipid kinase [Bacillus sp. B1-b2]